MQYSGQPSHDTAGAGQQARPQGRAGRVGRRRGAGLGVRGALGWAWQAWRTAGRARGRRGARQGRAAGRERGRRAGAGRSRRTAASARGARGALGLATGCALGALGLFSIRFDSVFFPESIFGHCS